MISNVLATCPSCFHKAKLEDVLTAQSNQNVIFTCPNCQHTIKNIKTSKG